MLSKECISIPNDTHIEISGCKTDELYYLSERKRETKYIRLVAALNLCNSSVSCADSSLRKGSLDHASIVEIVSVVSSNTSKSTRTVSRDVKIVTPFSIAVRRIAVPSS